MTFGRAVNWLVSSKLDWSTMMTLLRGCHAPKLQRLRIKWAVLCDGSHTYLLLIICRLTTKNCVVIRKQAIRWLAMGEACCLYRWVIPPHVKGCRVVGVCCEGCLALQECFECVSCSCLAALCTGSAARMCQRVLESNYEDLVDFHQSAIPLLLSLCYKCYHHRRNGSVPSDFLFYGPLQCNSRGAQQLSYSVPSHYVYACEGWSSYTVKRDLSIVVTVNTKTLTCPKQPAVPAGRRYASSECTVLLQGTCVQQEVQRSIGNWVM